MSEILSDAEYLRERLQPHFEDEGYISSSDLLIALRQLIVPDARRVLDFGCGGSPYRSLFSGAYVRADIESNPNRDVTLTPDSRLPADIGSFDFILSSQVLEHVEDPAQYLRECRRALTPDGALVLTTHGQFEDHPCPTDYWRWTLAGLEKAMAAEGLKVERALKVTVGPRYALFALDRELWRLGRAKPRSLHSMVFRFLYKRGGPALRADADRRFADFRVIEAGDPTQDTRYIIAAVKARPA